jgi:hypothetical protein
MIFVKFVGCMIITMLGSDYISTFGLFVVMA